MSTIALDYPNSIPLRRSSSVRWIIILVASLVLVASIILVAASSAVKADVVSSTSFSSVVGIPVPEAPTVDPQVLPTQTATPVPSPVVIAVPVATPPSQ
jgi:hypothetical protein